jgi:hypothetical protein
MALLYGRAGRLTAQNGGFRSGQCEDAGAELSRAELAEGYQRQRALITQRHEQEVAALTAAAASSPRDSAEMKWHSAELERYLGEHMRRAPPPRTPRPARPGPRHRARDIETESRKKLQKMFSAHDPLTGGGLQADGGGTRGVGCCRGGAEPAGGVAAEPGPGGHARPRRRPRHHPGTLAPPPPPPVMPHAPCVARPGGRANTPGRA